MPAKDLFHDAVKSALIKDGWLITHDPLTLDFGFTDAYIDLGAEKILSAEKDGEKIAVEIKSFVGRSEFYDFHTALGQFISYRSALNKLESDRLLFLGVPQDTFNTLFQQSLIADILAENNVKILVYNSTEEEIIKWIK